MSNTDKTGNAIPARIKERFFERLEEKNLPREVIMRLKKVLTSEQVSECDLRAAMFGSDPEHD